MKLRGAVALIAAGVATMSFSSTASAATAGASLVADINPAATNPHSELTAFDGALFFSADNGVNGKELWRSDGTPEGTELFKNIIPDPPEEPPHSSLPYELTVSGGKLFFGANTGPVNEGVEPFVSDGTEGGTILLKDINVFADSNPTGFTDVDGTVFFFANDSGGDFDLWKSEGTEGTTEKVAELPGSNLPTTFNATASGGLFYFEFDDGSNGRELWRSDGTFGGTMLVENIAPAGAHSTPLEMFDFNGSLLFSADDGTNGRELWISEDGTPANTKMVTDITGDATSSGPQDLALLPNLAGTADDEVLFAAGSNGDGFTKELWTTDGSAGNTDEVAGFGFGSAPQEMTTFNSEVYFQASDGPGPPTSPETSGRELWKSDGSEFGTVMIKDINTQPSFAHSDPELFTEFNGDLYFRANDGVNGAELWRTDGSESGTELVEDVQPGSGGGFPSRLTAAAGLLFFGADDGVHDYEIWRAPAENIPPETTIDAGPGEGTVDVDGDVSFEFSSNEEDSTFSCQLDDGPAEPCDSGTRDYTGLTDGSYTFSVAATDPSGNVDPSPAVRNFSVELPVTDPDPDPDPDPDSLGLAVAAADKQRSARKLVAEVACTRTCTVEVSGKLVIPRLKKGKKKQKLQLSAGPLRLEDGDATKVKVKYPKRAKKKLKKVFKKDKQARVKLKLTATDGDGGQAREKLKAVVTRKG